MQITKLGNWALPIALKHCKRVPRNVGFTFILYSDIVCLLCSDQGHLNKTELTLKYW